MTQPSRREFGIIRRARKSAFSEKKERLAFLRSAWELDPAESDPSESPTKRTAPLCAPRPSPCSRRGKRLSTTRQQHLDLLLVQQKKGHLLELLLSFLPLRGKATAGETFAPVLGFLASAPFFSLGDRSLQQAGEKRGLGIPPAESSRGKRSQHRPCYPGESRRLTSHLWPSYSPVSCRMKWPAGNLFELIGIEHPWGPPHRGQ